MTFLFPLVLGGLALLSVPLVLHLISRRKPKTLPFPAFRFLVQRRRSHLRKLRLRQLLLLALRLLVIAAVVLAVAQPKVFHDALQLATQRPTAVVLLFDTSSSMDYRSQENHARLDEAKRLAHELLDQLGPASRVIVLDSAETRDLGPKSWLARDEAHKAIDQLKLRPANAPVTAWLRQVYALFDKTARDPDLEVRRMPRLLCVYSDRTAACWDTKAVPALHDGREAVPPSLEQLHKVYGTLPALIELLGQLRQQLPPADGENFGDLTLTGLLGQLRKRAPVYGQEDYPDRKISDLVASVRGEARQLTVQLQKREAKDEAKAYRDRLIRALQALQRDLRGVREVFFDVGTDEPLDRAIVDLHFPELTGRGERLVFGKDEGFDLRVTLRATGQRMNAQVACEVDGKTVGPDKAAVIDKDQTGEVVFVVPPTKPGTHHVRVMLRGTDALAATDQRFATFTVRQPRRVLVVADPEKAAAADIWKRAVEARRDYLLDCEVKQPKQLLAADAEPLDRYRAVFLYEVAQPQELWPLLNGYVNRGGGLCVLPGGAELKPAAYQAAKTLLPAELVKVADAGKLGVPLDWNDPAVFQHPLLRPIGEWKKAYPLDFIEAPRRAYRYWEVKPTDARTLLTLADGKARPPVLLERQHGGGRGGRVLLLTTTVDNRRNPEWNNFMESDTAFCVVLPGLTANYLAGDPEDVRLNFTARARQAPVVPLPLEGHAAAYQLVADLLAVQPTGNKAAVPPLRPNVEVDGQVPGDGKNDLQLPQAVEPGNYTLKKLKNKDSVVARFSVNTPPEESDLTRVPLLEVEALLGIDSVVTVGQDMPLAEVLRQQWGEPLELFPYLMILLLFVLALENLLANKFYRREPEAAS